MTRSNLFIILILILLEGCTDNKTELKEIIVEKFPMTKNLGSDATGIKTLSKGNINILVVDTLLIIQKSTEPFLEIYSTNTNRLLTTYGEYGEGPGKIMNPIMIKGIERNNESSLIIVYDETKRLINKINLNNLINNKEPILMQYTLPFTGQYMLYFYFADQDFILGKTEGNNRFTHYSYKKDTVDFIPYIPKQNFTIYERFEPYVYRSSVAVNKQKGLIAAFPILLGSIDFFDLDGKLLKSTYFDDPDKLKPSVIENNNVEAYFYVMDSDSDQNYIYGLNINNRRSDLAGNNHKKLNVLVFDWNGKPVIKYILDNDQASEAIAFDSKHNRFYTYCRDCEESNILQFNISE